MAATPQELLEQKIRNMQVPQAAQSQIPLSEELLPAQNGVVQHATPQDGGTFIQAGDRFAAGDDPASALAVLRGGPAANTERAIAATNRLRTAENVFGNAGGSGRDPNTGLPLDIEERRKGFRERAQANIRLGSVEARERRLAGIRRPAVEGAERGRLAREAELEQERKVELAVAPIEARAAGNLAVTAAEQAGAGERNAEQIASTKFVQEETTRRANTALASELLERQQTGEIVGSVEQERLRTQKSLDALDEIQAEAEAKQDTATVIASLQERGDILSAQLDLVESRAASSLETATTPSQRAAAEGRGLEQIEALSSAPSASGAPAENFDTNGDGRLNVTEQKARDDFDKAKAIEKKLRAAGRIADADDVKAQFITPFEQARKEA